MTQHEIAMKNINLSEIARFIGVGVLNTFVDFFVLNILIAIFGLGQGGFRFAFFKACSFLVALVNSYFFNKYFVFKKQDSLSVSKSKEAGKFATVSVIGFLINVLISTLIFSLGNVLFSAQNPSILANLGAIFGTAVVLVWNYLGYKFFVFNQPTS